MRWEVQCGLRFGYVFLCWVAVLCEQVVDQSGFDVVSNVRCVGFVGL